MVVYVVVARPRGNIPHLLSRVARVIARKNGRVIAPFSLRLPPPRTRKRARVQRGALKSAGIFHNRISITRHGITKLRRDKSSPRIRARLESSRESAAADVTLGNCISSFGAVRSPRQTSASHDTACCRFVVVGCRATSFIALARCIGSRKIVSLTANYSRHLRRQLSSRSNEK